jgi:hypothetical protein
MPRRVNIKPVVTMAIAIAPKLFKVTMVEF